MKYMVDYKIKGKVESIVIKAYSVKECEIYIHSKFGKQCQIVHAVEIKRTTWR